MYVDMATQKLTPQGVTEGNLVIGNWYHFWTTTVRQGVMQLGELTQLFDSADGVMCLFKKAGTIAAYVVPATAVVEQAANQD